MAERYYNENDPFAAAWLGELMDAGDIPRGDIDTRSIEDVFPDELRRYTQCHFFAGIGGWARALALADWPDSRPIWTGSCPCQPFSAAGRGDGFTDKRHLWPAWLHIIKQCRPIALFGEQVAKAIKYGWLDLVVADLAGEGYRVGSAVLGAHSAGAPHERQRLYFAADTRSAMDNAKRARLERQPRNGENVDQPGRQHPLENRSSQPAGFWSDPGWVDCTDLRRRPIERGSFPLVDGLPAGMVPRCDPRSPGYAEKTAEARRQRIAGYGNAVVPQVAAAFVAAYMESLDGLAAA